MTAVLVAHDGAGYLPRALDALQRQTRLPDVLVGVDTASRDGSAELLEPVARHVVRAGRGVGFGDAVRSALQVLETSRLCPTEDPPRPTENPPLEPGTAADATAVDAAPTAVAPGTPEWLWLLHDDCAPDAGALERLLAAVEIAPSVRVAGCKQVGWDDPRRLHDVGFTVSRSGHRVTGIDADELDQGQHDDRQDVLVVSTAGMLVRRDVWDELGGPDPALPLFGDDVDLCRRARLAGHRVVVVPDAVVQHARAASTGRRPPEAAGACAPLADRRSALHLRLAQAPRGTSLLLVPVLVVAALVRSLVLLVLKRPVMAWQEWRALAAAVGRPGRVAAARRRAASSRRVPRSSLRPLTASPLDVLRQSLDRELRHRDREPDLRDDLALTAPEPGPVADDAVWLAPSRPRFLRLLGHPMTALTVLLLATSLLTGRQLLGGGALVAAALLPAPQTLAELWELALSDWRPDGLGRSAPGDPFLLVLTLLALPLAASPGLAVQAVLLLALPLAAVSAWSAAGLLTRSSLARTGAALAWAAMPPLLLGLDQGRVAAVLAHVLLPLAARAAARASGLHAPGRTRRPTVAAVAAAALVWAATAACAPVLLPAGLGTVLLTLALAHGRRRALAALAALTVLLMAPWWLRLSEVPQAVLADPSTPVAVAHPQPWSHLLLQSVEPRAWGLLPDPVATAVPWLVGGVLLAVAVLATLRAGGRPRAVTAGWLIALVGLAAALVAERVPVARTADGTVFGWAGTGVSLLALGLLAVCLSGFHGAARFEGAARRSPAGEGTGPAGERTGRRRVAWWGSLAALVAVAAVAAPVSLLAAWSWQRAGTQVDGAALAGQADLADLPVPVLVDPAVLPGVAVDEARSPRGARTLVLRVEDGTVEYQLARSSGPRFGERSTASSAQELASDGPDPAESELATTAVRLVSGSGQDLRPELARLGAGHVLLTAPAPQEVARSLDTTPGLVRASGRNSSVLWRVEPPSGALQSPDRGARARLLDPDGTPIQALDGEGTGIRTEIVSGAPGRRVVLAERADPGWQATLDGEPVPASQDSWAQAFELPEQAGTLVVEHHRPGLPAVGIVWWALLAVVGVLALPVRGRRS